MSGEVCDPFIMIDWNESKAEWVWVICQLQGDDKIHLLDVGCNADRPTAEREAEQALKAKEWLNA